MVTQTGTRHPGNGNAPSRRQSTLQVVSPRTRSRALLACCRIPWRSGSQLTAPWLPGELGGNCGVRCQSPGSTIADVGYDLAPEHWGNGYATEAVTAILGFGFRELSLHRIEARCVTANERSVRLLERLGFTEEERLPAGGVSRGYVWPERSIYVRHQADWTERSPDGN